MYLAPGDYLLLVEAREWNDVAHTEIASQPLDVTVGADLLLVARGGATRRPARTWLRCRARSRAASSRATHSKEKVGVLRQTHTHCFFPVERNTHTQHNTTHHNPFPSLSPTRTHHRRCELVVRSRRRRADEEAPHARGDMAASRLHDVLLSSLQGTRATSRT